MDKLSKQEEDSLSNNIKISLSSLYCFPICNDTVLSSLKSLCELSCSSQFVAQISKHITVLEIYNRIESINSDPVYYGKYLVLFSRMVCNSISGSGLSLWNLNEPLVKLFTQFISKVEIYNSHPLLFEAVAFYITLIIQSSGSSLFFDSIARLFAAALSHVSSDQNNDDNKLPSIISLAKRLPNSSSFIAFYKTFDHETKQVVLSLLDAVFASGEYSRQKVVESEDQETNQISILPQNIEFLFKEWAASIQAEPRNDWKHNRNVTLNTPSESNGTFLAEEDLQIAMRLRQSQIIPGTITLEALHDSTNLLAALASLLPCCDAEQKKNLCEDGYLASLIYCIVRGMADLNCFEAEGKFSLAQGWASNLGLKIIDDEGVEVTADRLMNAGSTLNIEKDSELYRKASERAGRDAELLGPTIGYRRDLIRAITNLCWMNPWGIDYLLVSGGVDIISTHLVHDNTNPLLREWSLVSLKTLAYMNPRMVQRLKELDMDLE